MSISAVAYSYVRMSTPEQLLGDSKRRQEDAAAAYCKRLGLELSDEQFNDYGVSGWRGKHRLKGALSRFLTALEEGRIARGSVLLVEEVDRLTREPMLDALALVTRILRGGITIATLNDGAVLTEETINANPMHIFMLAAKISIANGESTKKGARSRENFEQKRKRAHKGEIFTKLGPGWLEWSDASGKHEPHPEHSKAVKRAFELAAEGVSQTTICRTLTYEGFKPFGSDIWRTGYISKLLRNEATVGTFTTRKVLPDGRRALSGDRVMDYYPAVISVDLFRRAQAAIRPRNAAVSRKGKTYANLLAGLCHCDECGEPMRLTTVKDGKRFHRYLVCEGKRMRKNDHGRGVCTLRNFVYPNVEKAILSHVSDLDLSRILADPEQQGQISTLTEEIAQGEYKLADLKARLANLLDEMETAEPVLRGAINARMMSRVDEIAALENRLIELKATRNRIEVKADSRGKGPKVVAEIARKLAQEGDEERTALLRSRLSAALGEVITGAYFEASGDFHAAILGGLLAYKFVKADDGSFSGYVANDLSSQVGTEIGNIRPNMLAPEGSAMLERIEKRVRVPG